MNVSVYQASAPRFVNILSNLSAILEKAQAHLEARKIDFLRHNGVELGKRDFIGNP
jgi:hypothetical protein